MKLPIRRRRYLVDREAQGALLLRAVRYWVTSVFCVGSFTVLGWLFVWPGIPAVVGQWEQLSPMLSVLGMGLAASALIMPIVLYDFLRMTNRFAGPVYRLERSMRDLAAGRPVTPVKLRDDDYWGHLADAYNQVLARQQELEERLASREESKEPATSLV